MRQNPPSRELGRIPRLPSIQEHEPEREIRREPKRWLDGQVSLVLSGKQRAIARRGPLSHEVQVSLKAVLIERERLIFVNVNFERILR